MKRKLQFEWKPHWNGNYTVRNAVIKGVGLSFYNNARIHLTDSNRSITAFLLKEPTQADLAIRGGVYISSILESDVQALLTLKFKIKYDLKSFMRFLNNIQVNQEH